MQAERCVERLGRLEDRPERLVVEVAAVGVGVDDDALETETAGKSGRKWSAKPSSTR
jgi:hypothetical protein